MDESVPVGDGAGIAPGDVVGGYRVDELIGSGSMGVVYRAWHLRLERPVALKVIAPDLARRGGFRDLFLREATVAAGFGRLPSVVHIYDAGEDPSGRLYMAMQFIDGVTLAELIEPDGLPLARVARIVGRIAAALDAIHAEGVVHRDVKPGNVLVAENDGSDEVYLADFGLAGLLALGSRRGRMVGTPGYAAPEQIRGREPDSRSDIYSLACLAVTALTGRPPFRGSTRDAILIAQLTDPPPSVRALVPGLPAAVDAVIARAMAMSPAARHQSAGAFAAELEALRFDLMLAHGPDGAAAAEVAERLSSEGLETCRTATTRTIDEGIAVSSGCALVIGAGGIDGWGPAVLGIAEARAGCDRGFRVFRILAPGAPDPMDPRLAHVAGLAWVDAREGLDDDVLAQITRLAAPTRSEDWSDQGAQEIGCPYRGLEVFDEEHAAYFCGRDDEIALALERLRRSRFLAVVGPSGSGKSSLTRAGLVPAIRAGALGERDWRIAVFTPGSHPLAALREAGERLGGQGVLDAVGAEAPALLVIDQFEEAFTLCADEGERDAFIDALCKAATLPRGRVWVIIAARADFYHRLAAHPKLRVLVATQQFLVGPMGRDELRQAIDAPARRAGLRLAPGLTRRILADMGERSVSLPLLQHLLFELWERRQGRELTLEGYVASGGVEGAMARRADAVVDGLDDAERALAREVLVRLVQPGEGTEDTRRRASRAELGRGGDPATTDMVLEHLAAARLVTLSDDPVAHAASADLAHEALIRGWPRLRGWIDADRERLVAESRLNEAAALWEADRRDPSHLYRGARLLAASEAGLGDQLPPVARDFIAASKDSVDREVAARRRRTRLTITGLTVALVAVASGAGFALVQRDRAAGQRDIARSQGLAAQAEEVVGQAPETAVQLAEQALDTRDTAAAQLALRQATFNEPLRRTVRTPGDTALGSIAVSDAGEVVASSDGGDVLAWDLGSDAPPTLIARRTPDTRDFTRVAVSPDGHIAAGDTSGRVRLWPDAASAVSATRALGTAVVGLRFSADGKEIVVGLGDGRIVTLASADLAPRPSRRIPGIAFLAQFAARGDAVAALDYEHHVSVVQAGRTTIRAATIDGEANVLALSPEGGSVFVGMLDGTVIGLRTGAGAAAPAEIAFDASHRSSVNALAVSADGRFLASGGGDGTVRVWYAAGGAPIAILRGHEGLVKSVAFTADGDIVSAATDGTIRLWAWHRDRIDSPRFTSPILGFGTRASADGSEVLIAGLAGVRAWRPSDGRQRVVLRTPAVASSDHVVAEIAADGRREAVADSGYVRVNDAGGSSQRLAGSNRLDEVIHLSLAPKAPLVAVAASFEGVWLWRLRPDGGPARPWHSAMPDKAFGVALDAEGRTLVAGDRGGLVRVWDTAHLETPRDLGTIPGSAPAVAISPSGGAVAAAGSGREISVWPLTGSGARITLAGHRGSIQSVDFSPDGQLLVSAGEDGVRVWRWREGRLLLALGGFDGVAKRATFAGDGRHIAVQVPQTDGSIEAPNTITSVECSVCVPIDQVRTLARGRISGGVSEPSG